jgi:hypothetical protein
MRFNSILIISYDLLDAFGCIFGICKKLSVYLEFSLDLYSFEPFFDDNIIVIIRGVAGE